MGSDPLGGEPAEPCPHSASAELLCALVTLALDHQPFPGLLGVRTLFLTAHWLSWTDGNSAPSWGAHWGEAGAVQWAVAGNWAPQVLGTSQALSPSPEPCWPPLSSSRLTPGLQALPAGSVIPSCPAGLTPASLA